MARLLSLTCLVRGVHPGTLSNITINPRITLVVWDSVSDMGFQILGNSEKLKDISLMDGCLPDADIAKPLPQVERKIFVRAEKFCISAMNPTATWRKNSRKPQKLPDYEEISNNAIAEKVIYILE